MREEYIPLPFEVLDEFATEKFNQTPCHICGADDKDNWHYALEPDQSVMMYVFNDEYAFITPTFKPLGSMFFIPIVCSNCGETAFISRKTIERWVVKKNKEIS